MITLENSVVLGSKEVFNTHTHSNKYTHTNNDDISNGIQEPSEMAMTVKVEIIWEQNKVVLVHYLINKLNIYDSVLI